VASNRGPPDKDRGFRGPKPVQKSGAEKHYPKTGPKTSRRGERAVGGVLMARTGKWGNKCVQFGGKRWGYGVRDYTQTKRKGDAWGMKGEGQRQPELSRHQVREG